MSKDIYVIVEHLQNQVSEISYMMLAAGRALTQATNGKLLALLLGHQAEHLAEDLAADSVLYLDHQALAEFTSDAYQQVLQNYFIQYQPRAILFGHTSVGMDLASSLSAQMEWPLVGQCQHLYSENGELKFTSKICGGKLMASGRLPEPTAIITLVPGVYKPEDGHSEQPPEVTVLPTSELEQIRVRLVQYIEPEVGDVDISKEPILISVGRGLQNPDDLELVEQLAQAIGGVVASSRPLVDQGWLPATRLVGKSGKTVTPKLYLALGISGAPEHVEAITGSEMIVAVNTDPNAPIFNLAQYGVNMDLYDLVPALVEKIQQARSMPA
jgi:electron transfer flavoprotein alpha subunit